VDQENYDARYDEGIDAALQRGRQEEDVGAGPGNGSDGSGEVARNEPQRQGGEEHTETDRRGLQEASSDVRGAGTAPAPRRGPGGGRQPRRA